MSLWHRTRAEAAGAWRSLRYDMGRRPFGPPTDGPDVTSTGMQTFGWDLGPDSREMPLAGRPSAPRRRSRGPAALMTGLGLLTVTGAAGAYLVVSNGLVPLRTGEPAAAGTHPAVTAPAVPAESGLGSVARTGKRRSHLAAPAATVVTVPPPPRAPSVTAAPHRREAAVAPATRPAARATSTVRVAPPTGSASPLAPLDDPPVPTPTAPASGPTPTPSAPAPRSSSRVPGWMSAPDRWGIDPDLDRRAQHHWRTH